MGSLTFLTLNEAVKVGAAKRWPMLQLATDRDSQRCRCQTFNTKVKRSNFQIRPEDLGELVPRVIPGGPFRAALHEQSDQQ